MFNFIYGTHAYYPTQQCNFAFSLDKVASMLVWRRQLQPPIQLQKQLLTRPMRLGFSLSQLCFEGPEEVLTDTVNAQPAILAASIAILRAIESELGTTPLEKVQAMFMWLGTAWASIVHWLRLAVSAMQMDCAWCGAR